MPQIAQIAATYASQLFWLVVVFGLIYGVIGRGMLPKIEATVDARDQRIAGDLEAAQRARAAADEIEQDYRARAEAGRADALKLTQAAKLSSAQDNDARAKAADAANSSRVAEAEARIRAATDTALADIESVAADAARDLVARLSGATVTEAQAAGAVKKVMADV